MINQQIWWLLLLVEAQYTSVSIQIKCPFTNIGNIEFFYFRIYGKFKVRMPKLDQTLIQLHKKDYTENVTQFIDILLTIYDKYYLIYR